MDAWRHRFFQPCLDYKLSENFLTFRFSQIFKANYHISENKHNIFIELSFISTDKLITIKNKYDLSLSVNGLILLPLIEFRWASPQPSLPLRQVL